MKTKLKCLTWFIHCAIHKNPTKILIKTQWEKTFFFSQLHKPTNIRVHTNWNHLWIDNFCTILFAAAFYSSLWFTFFFSFYKFTFQRNLWIREKKKMSMCTEIFWWERKKWEKKKAFSVDAILRSDRWIRLPSTIFFKCHCATLLQTVSLAQTNLNQLAECTRKP